MGVTVTHLHDDCAFVVLSKLPLKSLIRFCCVSKTWSRLFDNTYFMNMFRKNFLLKNHSYYNDTSLLLHYDESWVAKNPYKSGMYSLSGERYDNMVNLDWPNVFGGDEWSLHILGSTSINDFLFIELKMRPVLWNPTTMEYKVIPPSPFSIELNVVQPYVYGLCYDPIIDDYKVIQQVMFLNEDEAWKDIRIYSLWEMYCLKSNTWKKLDIMTTYYQDVVGVHLFNNGVCHWLARSNTDEPDCETNHEVQLLSFNMSDEVFVTTSIPSNYMEDVDYNYLAMLNGSIALISVYAYISTFHISVLGDVGRNDSWIKLFIFKSLPCIGRPIGVSINGDIFFIKENEELAWINLTTEKIENLGVKGSFDCQIINYNKSHVPTHD